MFHMVDIQVAKNLQVPITLDLDLYPQDIGEVRVTTWIMMMGHLTYPPKHQAGLLMVTDLEGVECTENLRQNPIVRLL